MDSNASVSHLLNLPLEILLRILSLLHPHEVHRIRHRLSRQTKDSLASPLGVAFARDNLIGFSRHRQRRGKDAAQDGTDRSPAAHGHARRMNSDGRPVRTRSFVPKPESSHMAFSTLRWDLLDLDYSVALVTLWNFTRRTARLLLGGLEPMDASYVPAPPIHHHRQRFIPEVCDRVVLAAVLACCGEAKLEPRNTKASLHPTTKSWKGADPSADNHFALFWIASVDRPESLSALLSLKGLLPRRTPPLKSPLFATYSPAPIPGPAHTTSLLDDLLQSACSYGAASSAAFLLSLGADPTRGRNLALRTASEHGHVQCLELLLRDPRVDPTDLGNYSLRVAMERRHDGAVRRLLASGKFDETEYTNLLERESVRRSRGTILSLQ
ncbi:hypothetical protein HDU96_005659 [Phlyctochytrium bullatum]|nr:hypothetical protein HDU96_005659 [Phlyctochytrium bullatum]